MIASSERDVSTPLAEPARAPGPDTVVPLHNQQDLARSLAPLSALARRQRWVKASLVLTDLSVLWCCFIAGRLPAWFRDEMSLSQAMNIWWANNGQLRLTLFAAIAPSKSLFRRALDKYFGGAPDPATSEILRSEPG